MNDEKRRKVQEMFTSIAPRYDLNNTLLSFGLHHRWKRILVEETPVVPGDKILDLCAGTGDLASLLAKKSGAQCTVIALDLNMRMLSLGRQKLRHAHKIHPIHYVLGNAECLPFPDGTIGIIAVAFGIRNVTDIKKALSESYRVLRPGGRLICLEFSVPRSKLIRKLYDLYSFYALPRIGSIISGDRTGTYRYLPASIRVFPDQETLKRTLLDIGYIDSSYRNLTNGIVAIHTGTKRLE